MLWQVNKTKYLDEFPSRIFHRQSIQSTRFTIKEAHLKELREVAYFFMVRSILEYGSVVWDLHHKKCTLRIDQEQRRAVRSAKKEYRIYIKEEQQFNSVTKMINDLGWKDLAEGNSKHTCLMLFYKVANHEVNVPSDGILILILVKEGTRKSQVHNKFMYISSLIDDYIFYPQPS